MELNIHYLYPFDLGMELELSLEKNHYGREVWRQHNAGGVFFEGEGCGQATARALIYPFGIGMLEVSFTFTKEFSESPNLAIDTHKVYIERYALPIYFKSHVADVLQKAQHFMRFKYPERLEAGEEIFSLFVVTPWQEKLDADQFIHKNYKTLFGIVTNEPSYKKLSNYAFDKEELKNKGYYENEIILMKRYGAFFHSQEADMLKDLTALALAEYLNVKAANTYLEFALGRAQRILEEQPPYYLFWKIPRTYQKLSTEQLEFAKAKINLIESLHSAHVQIPAIYCDWHLKSVYQEISGVFDLQQQGQSASIRLETIDSIYSQLREQLSTVFFIFLDFVFVTWLLVDLGGWVILITRMK